MISIELHRRHLVEQGIDPDCMPDGYWDKYAAKRKAHKKSWLLKTKRKANKKPNKTKFNCNSCRLKTEDD